MSGVGYCVLINTDTERFQLYLRAFFQLQYQRAFGLQFAQYPPVLFDGIERMNPKRCGTFCEWLLFEAVKWLLRAVVVRPPATTQIITGFVRAGLPYVSSYQKKFAVSSIVLQEGLKSTMNQK